jgi:hypothetical protein
MQINWYTNSMSSRRGVHKLIPDHKGVAVENSKKNCPTVVGRTHHNAETAERSKTQIPEDKRQQ